MRTISSLLFPCTSKKPDSTSSVLHLAYEMGTIKTSRGVGGRLPCISDWNHVEIHMLSCIMIQELEQSWVGAVLEVCFLVFPPSEA